VAHPRAQALKLLEEGQRGIVMLGVSHLLHETLCGLVLGLELMPLVHAHP